MPEVSRSRGTAQRTARGGSPSGALGPKQSAKTNSQKRTPTSPFTAHDDPIVEATYYRYEQLTKPIGEGPSNLRKFEEEKRAARRIEITVEKRVHEALRLLKEISAKKFS